MSDFKIDLIEPEIRVVQDTDKGVHRIEASAEQLMHDMRTITCAGDFAKEVLRHFTSEHGQGALQDLLMDVVEVNMTESPARGLINKLIGKYHP